MFQRESRHPHKVQLLALARRFPISCLYFASPSFSQLKTASIPAIVDPSLSVTPAANVLRIQATLATSQMSYTTMGCKSTHIHRDCGRHSCRMSISCSPRVYHCDGALKSSTAAPCSAARGVSFNNGVGTSFQHVRHTAPTNLAPNRPRFSSHSSSSSVLGLSSIDARANPQFASHMSSIFTEQWAIEPSTLLLYIPNPLHFSVLHTQPLYRQCPRFSKPFVITRPIWARVSLGGNIGNTRFLAPGVVVILNAT